MANEDAFVLGTEATIDLGQVTEFSSLSFLCIRLYFIPTSIILRPCSTLFILPWLVLRANLLSCFLPL